MRLKEAIGMVKVPSAVTVTGHPIRRCNLRKDPFAVLPGGHRDGEPEYGRGIRL